MMTLTFRFLFAWVFGSIALLCGASAMAQYQNLDERASRNLPLLESKNSSKSMVTLYLEENNWLGPTGIQAWDHHEFCYAGDASAVAALDTIVFPLVMGQDSLKVFVVSAFARDSSIKDPDPITGYRYETPAELIGADDFSRFKEYRVSIPNLAPGDILEWKSRRILKKPLNPWQSGRIALDKPYPVLSHDLMVKIPEGDTTNYVTSGAVPEPRIDSNFVYWFIGESPGGEPGQPRREIEFSSLDSWAPIHQVLSSRLNGAGTEIELPADLEEAIAKASGESAKMNLLIAWINGKFRRLVYERHPDFAYLVRPLKRVAETGYGNSLELTWLLCTAAKAVGVECEPLILFSRQPRLPNLSDTETFLVRCLEGSGLHVVSPWSEPVNSGEWALQIFNTDSGPVQIP